MVSSRTRRFFDPLHRLLSTPNGGHEPRRCNICLFSLTPGFGSHHCNSCHIHIHDACADYFKATFSFFAHPWHPLTLRRIPGDRDGRFCDLCVGECPPGSFVYSCVTCSFDVHPLCSNLPQTTRSTLHPGHDLLMLPSSGACGACGQSLPVWNYRCSACYFKLHIACASNAPTGGGSYHAGCHGGSYGGATAYGNNYGGAGSHGSYGATTSGGQGDILVTPSRLNAIAKFLLKTTFHIAINAATGGLAEVLSAALGN